MLTIVPKSPSLSLMAKKKSVQSVAGTKSKGLFDHLRHLREVQDPKYFDTLTDADKKSWSNFMVCRFLSMQPELLEIVADAQIYTTLSPEQFYKVCLTFVPLGRCYCPYIKGKKDGKWNENLLGLLREHFQESEENVREYLEILSDVELRSIVEKYGYSEKETTKLLKQKESD